MVKNRSSFTIVESLVAMFLFALVMLTASIGIGSLKQIKHYRQAISFYQMLIQLESPHRNYQIDIDGNSLKFVNTEKPELKYILKISKDRLMMSTSEGGTMPILENIQGFSTEGRNIEVIFLDGSRYTGKLLNDTFKKEEK